MLNDADLRDYTKETLYLQATVDEPLVGAAGSPTMHGSIARTVKLNGDIKQNIPTLERLKGTELVGLVNTFLGRVGERERTRTKARAREREGGRE